MCSLKALPLKEATVIISETCVDRYGETWEELWPLSERQEKALDIRRHLLNSNGYEIHAGEVEESKAQRKIEREEAAEAWSHGDFTTYPSRLVANALYDYDVYEPEYVYEPEDGGLPDSDSPPQTPTKPRYTSSSCEELGPE